MFPTFYHDTIEGESMKMIYVYLEYVYFHVPLCASIGDENERRDKPYIWIIVAMLAVLSTILFTILILK